MSPAPEAARLQRPCSTPAAPPSLPASTCGRRGGPPSLSPNKCFAADEASVVSNGLPALSFSPLRSSVSQLLEKPLPQGATQTQRPSWVRRGAGRQGSLRVSAENSCVRGGPSTACDCMTATLGDARSGAWRGLEVSGGNTL